MSRKTARGRPSGPSRRPGRSIFKVRLRAMAVNLGVQIAVATEISPPPPKASAPLAAPRIMVQHRPRSRRQTKGRRHGSHRQTDRGSFCPRGLRHRQRHEGQGVRRGGRPGAGARHHLQVRPRHHAGDPCRLCPQPPGDDPGLPRHRQVDPYRTGRRAAELAGGARQPRQPHQPDRPDRQGRDQAARRQAGDGVPRGHPALGAAQPGGHRLRRIRRRPRRRDVRDPAGAGT